jgi:hypothetical protein
MPGPPARINRIGKLKHPASPLQQRCRALIADMLDTPDIPNQDVQSHGDSREMITRCNRQHVDVLAGRPYSDKKFAAIVLLTSGDGPIAIHADGYLGQRTGCGTCEDLRPIRWIKYGVM